MEKDMSERTTDYPDWVQEAEKEMRQEAENASNGMKPNGKEKKEVTIKFGKGLVGEPFTSKNGKQLVEVKIPNTDPDDKTPWASFVISPKMIHDNKFGKGVWMKLPEDGQTRIRKSVMTGIDETGKKTWEDTYKEIPNTELKAMMESYKTRDKEKDSVLGALQEEKDLAVKKPESLKKAKSKDRGIAK
ncbi:MAG: hypothetical protein SOI56_06065 [Eubacteriales bacterium]|jgi:hypothetical protein